MTRPRRGGCWDRPTAVVEVLDTGARSRRHDGWGQSNQFENFDENQFGIDLGKILDVGALELDKTEAGSMNCWRNCW
ncbi:MAG: hypothetical protein O2923_13265 [Verrucomicrobia bacterium]|nr:hypothetical protein [Verrucomicrobiota bacterium]MDA1087924.1 hypothetical protein [Verrucomicrobiota bacterium]